MDCGSDCTIRLSTGTIRMHRPMSPHNADFITEAHHAFSKAQLKELLTNYGKISELWFDMGANTPAQSKELYELVHQYQPDCMVSGRWATIGMISA